MTAKFMTERIKRVACYCRVSTDDQAKHGYSIQAQKDKLQSYLDQHDDMILVDFYIDDGVSAVKVGKRLALQRLLHDVKVGKIDMILFTKLDRWGRSVGIYYQIQSVLDEFGVIWKAIDEDYEIETSAGKFKVNIMMSVAQQERDRCSERIKDVFEHKIKNGEAIYGTNATPLGFKVENKQLIHDPETEEAVYSLIDFYFTFRSIRKAIVYMREQFGIDMQYASLRRLLKNPLLYGYYRGNDNYCKPYITKEKFDDMQRMIQRNLKEYSPTRTYIFSRMVVCPCCGKHMSGITVSNRKNGRKYEYPYYRCASAYTDLVCGYKKTIAQSNIEKQLLKKLSGFMEQYIVDCEIKSDEKAKVSRRSESSIRKEMDRLNDMYLKGRISVETYDLKYEKLEDELKDRSEAKMKPSDTVLNLQGVNLQELYKSFSDEEKSAFWHGLIDDIFIDENKEVINIIFSK